MEEDRDLDELKKAIDSGDKERAKLIATTLLKQTSKLPNPKQEDSSPPTWIILAILAICALAPVAYSILELWLKLWLKGNPKQKREVEHAYV